MLHDICEEEEATAIVYDTAAAFLSEADEREANGYEPAWWGVHGKDLQRYYLLICLFAGADVDGRGFIADELGLPDDRLETCEEEIESAYGSWGLVFDEMAEAAPSHSFVYAGGSGTLTEAVLAAEVDALNADFAMSKLLIVRVEDCSESNAYYVSWDYEVVMCAEFEDWLHEIAPRSERRSTMGFAASVQSSLKSV